MNTVTKDELQEILRLHSLWDGEEEKQDGENVKGKRADLSNLNLSFINLDNAYLFGANLSNADLFGCRLSKADLSGADLRGARLCKANLHKAFLYGALLSGANLCEANLSDACLKYVDLSNVILIEANLSGADVTKAILPDGVPVIDDLDRHVHTYSWLFSYSPLKLFFAAVRVAGKDGELLATHVGEYTAGQLIYAASYPDRPIPKI